MAAPVPIFRHERQKFEADTCLPVVEAAAQGKLRHLALVHGHYPGVALPPASLPELKCIGYWDAGKDQDWGLATHRNEGLEITLLQCGRLNFGLNNRDYTLHAGDLTITRPWQPHHVGDPNVTAGRLNFLIIDVGVRRPHQEWKWPPWIVLDSTDLKELTNALRHNEQPVWRVTPEMIRTFQAMAHAMDGNEPGMISRLTVKINELFVQLLELFRRREIPLDESLSSSQRTVELFLADLNEREDTLAFDWTVEEMARSCRLGVTQFFHHVKTITNLTPMHYLNQQRLELAARRLAGEPSASITEISLACGFSSSQYFATSFHRRYGCTPREFRNRHAAPGPRR